MLMLIGCGNKTDQICGIYEGNIPNLTCCREFERIELKRNKEIKCLGYGNCHSNSGKMFLEVINFGKWKLKNDKINIIMDSSYLFDEHNNTKILNRQYQDSLYLTDILGSLSDSLTVARIFNKDKMQRYRKLNQQEILKSDSILAGNRLARPCP